MLNTKQKNKCPHYNLGFIERFVEKMHDEGVISESEYEDLKDAAHFVAEELPYTTY